MSEDKSAISLAAWMLGPCKVLIRFADHVETALAEVIDSLGWMGKQMADEGGRD